MYSSISDLRHFASEKCIDLLTIIKVINKTEKKKKKKKKKNQTLFNIFIICVKRKDIFNLMLITFIAMAQETS